ncbi:phosphate/phosphite/phosphonate ABC transporter substrate-binding protein [Nitrospirales bacterium NOB]|nr:phosphate/phosphite/phosphonate ABC transporter substrate-binding protein [Nitrospirales bacterium NOB]
METLRLLRLWWVATASNRKTRIHCLAFLLVVCGNAIAASVTPLEFGVISQRSPILTAQYWNPIIRYVSERSGVPIRVRIGKTGVETSEMIKRGEVDFIFSNHIFHPGNQGSGYYVIARDGGKPIYGQLVVPRDSPIKTISDLASRTIVFPSRVAFVGYMVPYHQLYVLNIPVNVRFAGNQEGAIGQLVAGTAVASGVNSEVMREFALREKFEYRAIWTSKPYLNMPIAAKPSVPKQTVDAVRKALVGMKHDPEGRKILLASARAVGQDGIDGFETARDDQYQEQRALYKQVVQLQERNGG